MLLTADSTQVVLSTCVTLNVCLTLEFARAGVAREALSEGSFSEFVLPTKLMVG